MNIPVFLQRQENPQKLKSHLAWHNGERQGDLISNKVEGEDRYLRLSVRFPHMLSVTPVALPHPTPTQYFFGNEGKKGGRRKEKKLKIVRIVVGPPPEKTAWTWIQANRKSSLADLQLHWVIRIPVQS